MNQLKDLLLDLSILYRSTQKYYDRQLQDINLTYAQLPILILIYENEGLSLQDVALKGDYDKGTVSKNVRHLQNQAYIRVQPSAKDKRNKELYTTSEAKAIMSKVYEIRRDWWKHLIKNIDEEDLNRFLPMYQAMTKNASTYKDAQPYFIHFYDWQKVSLSAYPDQVSTILRVGGCNFRCPQCIQSNLVYVNENQEEIPIEDVYAYLNKRKDVLQAVCISGGEPLMNKNLHLFLSKVKSMGFKVKLSTNGSYPERLKQYVEKGLIDYVELAIKNSPKMYGKTIGMVDYDFTPIRQSVDYVLSGSVDYAFKISLTKEFHSLETVKELAQWIDGAKKIIVDTNVDARKTIQRGVHPMDTETFEQAIQIFQQHVQIVEIGEHHDYCN